MGDDVVGWYTARELGKKLGMSARSVRHRYLNDQGIERRKKKKGQGGGFVYRVTRKKKPAPEPATDYRGLADELDQADGTDEILDHFVDRWRLRRKHRRTRTTRTQFHLGDKPVAVVCLADQHIGAPGTRADMVVRDARLVARTEGAWCCNIGDTINNMVVGRLATKGAHQDDSTDDQWLFLRAYMRLLAPSCLWWVAGNHELWSAAIQHLDPTGLISSELNVCYDQHQMAAELTVGALTYRVASRHQYKGNSMYNDVHANNRLYLEGNHEAFDDRHPDVILLGHKHTYAYSKQNRNGRLRTYVSVGSYKTADSYGRAKGFLDALPYMGVLVLHPRTHRIEVHEDLPFVCREYLPWLRAR